MRALLLALASTLTLASAAAAQPSDGSSLALQQPIASPSRVMLDGIAWRCAGAACVATGEPRSQSPLRACQRFAAQLGAVTAFTYSGRTLGTDQLPACNAQARQSPLVRTR